LRDDFSVLLDPMESGEERFSYDVTGNLFDSSGREYDGGNQILRRGATEYRWNRNGQLAEKRHRTVAGVAVTRYQWNDAGLLRQVDLPDGRRVTFGYDPFARRVHKRVLSPVQEQAPQVGQPHVGKRAILTETRFCWDGQRIAQEVTRRAATVGPEGLRPMLDPTSAEPRLMPAETRTYCHEDGSFALLAGKLPDGTWAHYVNDVVGTPEALFGSDGKPLGELERRAWRMEDPEGLTPFRFPGQYEDEETGLCYNRYRYYDPELGRFVSADPVGLRGGANVFSYAPNAVSWLDPLGLTTFYRGGESLEPRTMRDGRSEFVSPNPETGRKARGISLHTDPTKVERYGGAYRVTSIPPELTIEQRGRDPEHYELVARGPMTEEQYREALTKVEIEPPGRQCE
jgi:RHS repeat-associated protein